MTTGTMSARDAEEARRLLTQALDLIDSSPRLRHAWNAAGGRPLSHDIGRLLGRVGEWRPDTPTT